jgi:hypothetical protein
MFNVVSSYEELSEKTEQGEVCFVSNQNSLYIFSNDSWEKYEDVGLGNGVEVIAHSEVDQGLEGSEEAFVFSDAPHYEFLMDTAYPVHFSCKSISPIDNSFPGKIQLVNEQFNIYFDGVCQTKIEEFSFKIFLFVKAENKELNVKKIERALNVRIENCIVEGPSSLTVYGPKE